MAKLQNPKKIFASIIFMAMACYLILGYQTGFIHRNEMISDIGKYLLLKESHGQLTAKFNSVSNHSLQNQEDYLVWSPKCKISKIDPWDKSILPFLKKVEPIICSNISLLTYIEKREKIGHVLKVNTTAGEMYYKQYKTDTISCCYSVISRLNQSNSNINSQIDNNFALSNCTHFQEEITLPAATEFIFVKCNSSGKGEKETYKNVHAMVPILPSVMERKRNNGNGESPKRLNVLIIGLDSVSRLNFHRFMPKSLEHLEKNEWVEFNGYTKVGDGTWPNILGFLTGEDHEFTWKNFSRRPDSYPIIWKDYKKKNYVTAYAEDWSNSATFNRGRKGFLEQPTDSYMRPFVLAAERLLPLKFYHINPLCCGGESIINHIFNYAKDFSKTFQNDFNYFGLFWINALTHDSVNIPENMDTELNSFLEDLLELGAYNNTLVILLSDHGTRFGPIRKTFFGYYEDRLPFFFIRIPKWFRDKYPKKYANLLVNRNRLTSTYDLYVTLKKIVDEDYADEVSTPISKACPTCLSFFDEIPWDRGCEDAGIVPQWCMCSNLKELKVSEPVAVEAAKVLFQYVLNRTKILMTEQKIDEKLCANRTFSKIVSRYQDAGRSKLSPTNGYHYVYYTVTIEVNPGLAIFQGMIEKYQKGNEKPLMRVIEPITRLDPYDSVSKCVDTKSLKFLCHCVK